VFNRTTLLLNNNFPDGENPAQYYQNSPTNHYSRIMHAANLMGGDMRFRMMVWARQVGRTFREECMMGRRSCSLLQFGGRDAHTKMKRRRAVRFDEEGYW
jgi:hypothetical protein